MVNGNIDTVNLKDPGTGKVYGSTGAGNAAAVYPPGYEWSYTQRTTDVTVVSTTESSGTAVLSPAAFTPDGGVVMCEFFSPSVTVPIANDSYLTISLFEGSTEIGSLALVQNGAVAVSQGISVPVCAKYRFTPSNAAHTYTVTAFVSNTAVASYVAAGAGGTATYVPAYVRFTKV